MSYLSRQELSETETSGTNYTDATRTDDPYRGSTSHGKNRRLMRALLQVGILVVNGHDK